eukprot:TRINITY_DN4282_c0_g1_i2.p1 TRINITY_DN4282_c0_g1~~TRINITY_DN4282_c0_g1_i2.p1  ORF type:complete len:119 (-),score=14.98 TRINITY_DN4282_c0_g1_i2:68-424(-)
MSNYTEPHKILSCLLSTARSIQTTINAEQGKKGVALGADDFLPIFIYVVANSEVENMEAISQYLWSLADPEELTGQLGYYLTVFCSSLEFIKNTSLEEMERKVTSKEIISDPNFLTQN